MTIFYLNARQKKVARNGGLPSNQGRFSPHLKINGPFDMLLFWPIVVFNKFNIHRYKLSKMLPYDIKMTFKNPQVLAHPS